MRHLNLFIFLCLLLGTAYRLWPVLVGMPALANFFITEDGYLMLTVARNMAIGNGMSVSDGTIATNGVQPLAAFLFAIPYWVTGGDKTASLTGIHLIHAATALADVFVIRAFAARLLAPRHPHPHWPWVVALLWFLSPLLLRHSMNGLETSLITLVAITTILAFANVLDAPDNLARRLTLGALCGVAVLARNDAVFLVTALFLTWAIWDMFVLRQGMIRMCLRLVPPGILSIAVAAPWLLNNLLRFGSIVPVSGTAQSLDVPIGANLPLLPAKIFEYSFPMLPIPNGLETQPLIMILAASATGLSLGVFLWQVTTQSSGVARALTATALGYGSALALYYGLFFGAPHFLSRYLAPVAPLLILATLIAALEVGRLLRLSTSLGWLYSGAGGLLIAGLLIRAAVPGVTLQGHEQVIAWTDENLSEEVWVGAVQTGTLGYWHDRTLNLDGKVNPEALIARRTEGHVLNYVTKSKIDYVVDWVGMGDWIRFESAQDGFADSFILLLQDPNTNLAVLARRTALSQ